MDLWTRRLPEHFPGRTRAVVTEKAVRSAIAGRLIGGRVLAATANHVLLGHRMREALISVAPVSLYSIYRRRNTYRVLDLLGGLGPSVTANLHALDECAPELATQTRSSGPGQRMQLLQELIDGYPPPDECWVILADDDVTWAFPGDGESWRRWAQLSELDVSQPGHFPSSNHVYRLNDAKPLTLARRTGFVEVGPLVLMSPKGYSAALPFPKGAEMGWGLDIDWSFLSNLAIGVVDCTPMVHHGAVSSEYSGRREGALLDERLVQYGLVDARSFIETRPTVSWRLWQRFPPWVRDRSSGS